MAKKKKHGDEKDRIATIIFITAILQLIDAILEIIEHLPK